MTLMRSSVRLVTLWILALLLGGVAAAPLSHEVARVTLAIGDSHVVHDGNRVPLATGSDIYEGDRIETEANGHVHLRFVDDARVSVRPESVLQIENYRYDPADARHDAVRFTLREGVVRAISGSAAHQARDRFRLNTPLVAIGVRGTDFTTQTHAGVSAVVVNQGAVVLTPLGQGCPTIALGPCEGKNARELSAHMSNMALVYHANANEPSFQPLNTLKGGDHITPILEQEQQSSSPSAAIVADSREPSSVVSLLPQHASLIWGRWQSGALPGDNLTVPFMQAFQNNQVMVGDGYYFLFRSNAVPALLPSMTGTAQFSLQNSTANYRSPGNLYSAAAVQGGSLAINFSQDTFATSLSLSSPATGAQSFSTTGRINPTTGIFVSSDTGSHVAGAVSLDTLQAGYLFSKPLSNGGTLMGATLWGR